MDQVNHSIKCNVTTCDYHAGRQNLLHPERHSGRLL